MEPKTSLPHPLSSCPTASSLLIRAAALDCEAEQLYARAEFSSRYGALVAGAVRDNCRAVELETAAEVLRHQAARVADMTLDADEMRREGFTRDEINFYLQRTYGKAVAK